MTTNPRRRCAYCDSEVVPGLRHHLNWPVCAKHETSEELMDLPLATDQIPASIEAIRDRLDFIERDVQDVASRYDLCRKAARRLAQACYAAPLTDPDVTRAYDAFMSLDAGNFAVSDSAASQESASSEAVTDAH